MERHYVRFTAASEVPSGVNVNGCLSVCVSPVVFRDNHMKLVTVENINHID